RHLREREERDHRDCGDAVSVIASHNVTLCNTSPPRARGTVESGGPCHLLHPFHHVTLPAPAIAHGVADAAYPQARQGPGPRCPLADARHVRLRPLRL